MIRQHKRSFFAVLSTLVIIAMFLGVFQLLQPASEAHDMCASKKAAVKSAYQSLVSAQKKYTAAKSALAACEAKHKQIHDDPG